MRSAHIHRLGGDEERQVGAVDCLDCLFRERNWLGIYRGLEKGDLLRKKAKNEAGGGA